jgi:hypothetical protein
MKEATMFSLAAACEAGLPSIGSPPNAAVAHDGTSSTDAGDGPTPSAEAGDGPAPNS